MYAHLSFPLGYTLIESLNVPNTNTRVKHTDHQRVKQLNFTLWATETTYFHYTAQKLSNVTMKCLTSPLFLVRSCDLMVLMSNYLRIIK